jgi:hypothetical protein
MLRGNTTTEQINNTYQAMIEKMDLIANIFVILDGSGSMNSTLGGRWYKQFQVADEFSSIRQFDVAAAMAITFSTRNPVDQFRNTFGWFSSTFKIVGKTKFVGVSEPNTCYPNTKIYADIDNYDNVYFTKKACSITFYPGYLFDNACYYGDFCPYVDDGRWWIYKKISNNGPYYFESGPSGFMYIGCTYGIQYEDYLNTSECPYALFNCSILDSRYCFGFAESGIFKVKLRLENRRPLHHPSGYVYEGTDIKYVHVVDCNTNSGLITNGGDLSNDVNYWGNNYSAGSFWLRANDNNYINNNDVILTACNKIEMYDGFDTGVSGLFVAQTGNDIFQDCASCSGYKNDISFTISVDFF